MMPIAIILGGNIWSAKNSSTGRGADSVQDSHAVTAIHSHHKHARKAELLRKINRPNRSRAVIMCFISMCFRLSFYGQLLEQLQCCLTVRPCCLYLVLLFCTADTGQIYDDHKCCRVINFIALIGRNRYNVFILIIKNKTRRLTLRNNYDARRSHMHGATHDVFDWFDAATITRRSGKPTPAALQVRAVCSSVSDAPTE